MQLWFREPVTWLALVLPLLIALVWAAAFYFFKAVPVTEWKVCAESCSNSNAKKEKGEGESGREKEREREREKRRREEGERGSDVLILH
jgi:hypothetical protein